MQSAPLSTAHCAQREKSSATSSIVQSSFGVATTDTARILCCGNARRVASTSARQTSGDFDGIPNATAQLPRMSVEDGNDASAPYTFVAVMGWRLGIG